MENQIPYNKRYHQRKYENSLRVNSIREPSEQFFSAVFKEPKKQFKLSNVSISLYYKNNGLYNNHRAKLPISVIDFKNKTIAFPIFTSNSTHNGLILHLFKSYLLKFKKTDFKYIAIENSEMYNYQLTLLKKKK